MSPAGLKTPEELGCLLLREVAQQHCDMQKALDLIGAGACPEQTDRNGNTALILCASYGHTAVARALVAAQVDLNARNNDGYTALLRATINGKEDIVDALIEAGACLDEGDLFGHTPLMMAAAIGRPHIVQSLLDAGADRHQKSNSGMTALDTAKDSARQVLLRETLKEKEHALREACKVFHTGTTQPVRIMRPVRISRQNLPPRL